MRKIFSLLCFVVCCLLSATASAQIYSISETVALGIAQKQFQGQDVDYYIQENRDSLNWVIFVDAEPLKGWQHNCYLLSIPKTSTVPGYATTPKSKIALKLLPRGNFKPLLVKNRYGTNANATPRVPKIVESNGQSSSAAQRTYAIILSGGVSKISNYERYWNDCSFIYQTLVNRYGVPKDNIVPLMSDGNNPAEDMISYTGYKSQPLDLDFDGVDEITLSASKANLQASLASIKSKIQKDDQLFFFVIDHGGSTDNNTNSYRWENSNGDTLGDGPSLTVSPMATDTKYTVFGVNNEGELAEGSITIDAIKGIRNATWQEGSIKVVLHEEAPDNSHITISSIINGTVITSIPVMKGDSEILISLPNIADGSYTVSYLQGENIIDSLKISK